MTVWGTWGKVPTALLEDRTVSAGAVRLYAVLDDRADRASRTCWPSVATLMDQMGVSRSSVYRALRELEERGWIERQGRFHEGQQTSNSYLVHATPTGGGVTSDIGGGVTGDTPRGVTSDTQNQNQMNQNQSSRDFGESEQPPEPRAHRPTGRKIDQGKIINTPEDAKATVPSSERTRAKAPKLGQIDEYAFENWWKGYPRKTGKAKAREAWARHVVPNASRSDAMTVALNNYRASLAEYEDRTGTPQTFILHASTFLNGRWEDWADGTNLDAWHCDPAPEHVDVYGGHQLAGDEIRALEEAGIELF